MLQTFQRSVRPSFTLLAVSLGLVATACNSRPNPPAPGASAAPTARETVEYLASDALEGRGVGTKGIDAAADYIANRFKRAGLRPAPGMSGYFQTFAIMSGAKVGDGTSLAAGDASFKLHEQFRPMSFSASGTFDAPAVFAGYGIASDEHGYDDYAGLDVRGKVVLAFRFEPHTTEGSSRFAPKDRPNDHSEHATLERKAKLAAEKGAAALLIVTPPTHHKEQGLLPLARRYSGGQVSIPVVHVTGDVATTLLEQSGTPQFAELQKMIDDGGKPASRDLTGTRVRGDVRVEKVMAPSKNVIAVLPGHGPRKDEYVVVGAHYDHVGRGGVGGARLAGTNGQIHNGADDNASGTTVLLQLAERFARAKQKLDRSIVFVAFTAEEWGLLGSHEFVSSPPVPLNKIAAMVNLDMVGRVRDETIYVGGAGTAAAFDAIVKAADDRSPLKMKGMGRGGIGPSDHSSFAMKKIPVLFLFSGMHGDYHRPTDDPEKVNYAGIDQVTDFTSDLVTRIVAMPPQQYVNAIDPKSPAATNPHTGAAMGGIGVTLGVVPDYSSDGSDGGLRLSGVSPGSPAEAAGLKEGDVLVRFDDKKIADIYDLTEALQKGKPGQRVKLIVKRGGTETELHATLAEKG